MLLKTVARFLMILGKKINNGTPKINKGTQKINNGTPKSKFNFFDTVY